MNYQISNQNLIIEISDHGAEMKKVTYFGIDYLHDSNPSYWNRSAPILFPNIGSIKDGFARIDGTSYEMKKHGFLRDRNFVVTAQDKSSITFSYKSTNDDLALYPYEFCTDITYQIHGNILKSYIVIKNFSNSRMMFNLGLHPAFKVPLFENEKFEDYHFEFKDAGDYKCPAINLENGTIDFNKTIKEFTNLKTLPLNYDDYKFDALVFQNLSTHNVKLVNKDSSHGVSFEFNDFPMLGIWTPNHAKANFICIEPWIGCADPSDHDNDFTKKRHLMYLEKDEMKLISCQIKFF